jgi:D-cysteine desulfhydrase
MQAQADPAHVQNNFNSLLLAHGSGGTQAGLILGKLLSENKVLSDCRIWGVNVAYDREKSFQLVKDILWSAIQQFRLPISFMSDDINVLDGFIGLGYAQNTREELDFFWKVARAEGLLLDPTYTGKAFWGLWQTVKKDKAFFGKKILFLHTGGSFGQFKLSAEWGDLFGG